MITNNQVSRTPRLWSNVELRRFASLFRGDVANVSGWRDEDKEGLHYRDYFACASSYTITNFRPEARGYQGTPGEIFLDLEAPLPAELHDRFDVVFNHTVLEHVFEFRTAFANLCAMSRDLVVLVVPWLQPFHGDYGDYWRFSPQAIERLFEKEGMTSLYVRCNDQLLTSVYVFAIASKHPERWTTQISTAPPGPAVPGARAVPGYRNLLRTLVTRWGRSSRSTAP